MVRQRMMIRAVPVNKAATKLVEDPAVYVFVDKPDQSLTFPVDDDALDEPDRS